MAITHARAAAAAESGRAVRDELGRVIQVHFIAVAVVDELAFCHASIKGKQNNDSGQLSDIFTPCQGNF